MSKGQRRSLYTITDDWADKNTTTNNEDWSTAIFVDKEEIGITKDFSITQNRISDLEAQIKELKTKKKCRKLKIKVKM